ncbi:hypothetical protein EGW08_021926, partial [Elysia chlorotica]
MYVPHTLVTSNVRSPHSGYTIATSNVRSPHSGYTIATSNVRSPHSGYIKCTFPTLWLYYSYIKCTFPTLWLYYSYIKCTFPTLWLHQMYVPHTLVTSNVRSPHSGYIKCTFPTLWLHSGYIKYSLGLGRLMWQMPAAFTDLGVPNVYALVFFLAAFLFWFMFLCVGTLTIVDNIVDAIKKSLSCQPCNRITVSIFVTFFVTISALGIGSLQTMQVGHYVFFSDHAVNGQTEVSIHL